MAYVTFQVLDGQPLTQLWVVESPYQTPRLILNAEADNVLYNYHPAWAHDGRQLAYSHFVSGDRAAISVVDIQSLEHRQLFSVPKTSGSLEVAWNGWSFDNKWLAITLRYGHPTNGFEVARSYLVNTQRDQIIELDDTSEWVAWSMTDLDHFMYITHPTWPDFGNETVLVGRVGQPEPVLSISDLGRYAPQRTSDLTWSPDGRKVVVTSYESNIHTFVTLVDTQTGKWSLLSSSPKVVSWLGLWSPDGRWLIVRGSKWYFWEFTRTDEPDSTPLHEEEFAQSMSWTSDSNMLIYQDGRAIYAVNPLSPEEPIPILDLTAFGIISKWEPSLSIWVPALHTN